MEKQPGLQTMINNDFYESLQDQWYTAQDHPIALLRAENAIRAPWVEDQINNLIGKKAKILDIGCGAGFLSNYLVEKGHKVTGIDLSQNSLEVAKRHDRTQSAEYLYGNAYQLPFEDGSFDVACAMDILEHVEEPERLIKEAARVLKPGGLFFFHTFNRNPLSYLIIIKGVDWFVHNAPKNMHVYELFIKPEELKRICEGQHLEIKTVVGLVPKATSSAFWKMLFTKKVPSDYQFQFVKSLSTGYCGIAIK